MRGTDARRSCDIPELTVILGVVVASGEWQRLGRRRLTRFPHVARGLTCQRCVVAPRLHSALHPALTAHQLRGAVKRLQFARLEEAVLQPRSKVHSGGGICGRTRDLNPRRHRPSMTVRAARMELRSILTGSRRRFCVRRRQRSCPSHPASTTCATRTLRSRWQQASTRRSSRERLGHASVTITLDTLLARDPSDAGDGSGARGRPRLQRRPVGKL